jgi:hypothetical protein
MRKTQGLLTLLLIGVLFAAALSPSIGVLAQDATLTPAQDSAEEEEVEAVDDQTEVLATEAVETPQIEAGIEPPAPVEEVEEVQAPQGLGLALLLVGLGAVLLIGRTFIRSEQREDTHVD